MADDFDFEDLRNELLPAEQLKITDLARKYGLHDNDPLWGVIAAMGKLEHLTGELPAQIDQASERFFSKIEIKISSINNLINQLEIKSSELKAQVKTAAEAGAAAAVSVSVSSIAAEAEQAIIPVIESQIEKITEEAVFRILKGSEKSWAGIRQASETHASTLVDKHRATFIRSGLKVGAGIMILSAALAGSTAYFAAQHFAPAARPQVVFTPALNALAECSTGTDGKVYCQPRHR